MRLQSSSHEDVGLYLRHDSWQLRWWMETMWLIE